jgi:hypothetical protein
MIRKKYRCVPNVISYIFLSPVVWKDKMAPDDIAFLLNRGELVESHEIKQSWKVKMAADDIAFLLNRGELVEPHEIKSNSYCTSANIKIFFLV